MTAALRVLHVEDAADDGELVLLELEAAGYQVDYQRVETAASMEAALASPRDVVVSDFNLPSFDAYGALRLLQASGQDIPFIVVSGVIGEMVAVSLMKSGAHDYVMKGQLARLAPAIEREIREAAVRRQRRQEALALAESQRQLQELSGFLQQAREQEGTRIARELHDELGQALTALRIDIQWLERKLPGCDEPVGARLANMRRTVDQTVETVRRISENLRPGMLDDLGLAAAVESHVAKFARHSGIACDLAMNRDEYALDDATATALFRVLQEALTNVARHAQARRVAVSLQDRPGQIVLAVQDDGCGLPPPGAGRRRGYGLLGMAERIKLLGGRLDISGAPGAGTRIEACLPQPALAEGTDR
jgi:signal transduction histidine kinase